MKKLLLSFIVAVIFSIPSYSQSSDYAYSTFIQSDFELPFRILWPMDFDSTAQYPVLLFLHGAGERGSDNEKQLMHGGDYFTVQNLTNTAPLIVIFPQCPEDQYWATVHIEISKDGSRDFQFTPDRGLGAALQSVLHLIDSLLLQPWVNPSRFYIGGLSMGGMGTLELIYNRPQTFAAAFAIAAGGNEILLTQKISDTPLWLFHGEADNIVPSQFSEKLFLRLQEQHSHVLMTLYPDIGHNAWDQVFSSTHLLSWLLSHAREGSK